MYGPDVKIQGLNNFWFIGPVKENNLRKNAIIFLSFSLTCVLDAQKNRLIEKVLLSTNNICLVEKSKE